MADPLSVASGVMGVVSAGLVTCEGLVSYFSAYKGQDHYLDSLTQRAENLQCSLTFLRQALPLWREQPFDTASRIEQHAAACQAGIVILSGHLSGFKPAPESSLRRDKFQHLVQKTAFPFKKTTIVEMSGILDGFQENLNTILSIAGLYVKTFGCRWCQELTMTREAFSNLVKAQNVANAKIDTVLSDSSVATTDIQNLAHDVSSLRAGMSTIQNDLQVVKSILGPGAHTILQRSDSANLTVPAQTSQPWGAATDNNRSQQILELKFGTKTYHQPMHGRSTSSTADASKWFPSSICLCSRAKTRRPQGSTTLAFDLLRIPEHEEDCPYYFPGGKRRKLDLWIRYRSLLTSHRFRFMASVVTGSVGSSIRATVDWLPIVSSEASRAMQLLSELKERLANGAEPDVLIDGVRTELMGLFAQRKAHPREVDQDGNSLLHVRVHLANMIDAR